jgi:carbonic anhydrase
LGSLRFAVNHFSSTLKLLLVLGHSQCGAVTEAVNAHLEPRRYMEMATDYSTRAIEDQILFAVRVATMTMETVYGPDLPVTSGYRSALLQASVALNAAWSAYCLRQEFGSTYPHVGIVFGVYDLVSRSIGLPLSASAQGPKESAGLFVPPADVEQFRELAYGICSSAVVRALLREPARQHEVESIDLNSTAVVRDC